MNRKIIYLLSIVAMFTAVPWLLNIRVRTRRCLPNGRLDRPIRKQKLIRLKKRRRNCRGEFIPDEKLQKVIETALLNNRDLRIAALNVERARAYYGTFNAPSFFLRSMPQATCTKKEFPPICHQPAAHIPPKDTTSISALLPVIFSAVSAI